MFRLIMLPGSVSYRVSASVYVHLLTLRIYYNKEYALCKMGIPISGGGLINKRGVGCVARAR